jgi:hypothetical protein
VLVIGIGAPRGSSDHVTWSGRRHDDDGPGAIRGRSSQELFDAVFHALHDGEQVAVGTVGTLSVPVADEQPDEATTNERAAKLLADAQPQTAEIAEIQTLLDELGQWRPWTVVSTSLARWRATTSVLVWHIQSGDTPLDASAADAAVDAFYERLRAGTDDEPDPAAGRVLNLPAAIAMRAGLGVDSAQLHEPPLSVASSD